VSVGAANDEQAVQEKVARTLESGLEVARGEDGLSREEVALRETSGVGLGLTQNVAQRVLERELHGTGTDRRVAARHTKRSQSQPDGSETGFREVTYSATRMRRALSLVGPPHTPLAANAVIDVPKAPSLTSTHT
jgi:hypothetical protein